jgi:hypothetical protein
MYRQSDMTLDAASRGGIQVPGLVAVKLSLQNDVSMAYGVHLDDESRVGRNESDASEFGRRVRQFAQDAHRILRCPDSRPDELFELHSRVFHLLREAPGAGLGGIRRWLLSVREQIGGRLQSWSVKEFEPWVA